MKRIVKQGWLMICCVAMLSFIGMTLYALEKVPADSIQEGEELIVTTSSSVVSRVSCERGQPCKIEVTSSSLAIDFICKDESHLIEEAIRQEEKLQIEVYGKVIPTKSPVIKSPRGAYVIPLDEVAKHLGMKVDFSAHTYNVWYYKGNSWVSVGYGRNFAHYIEDGKQWDSKYMILHNSLYDYKGVRYGVVDILEPLWPGLKVIRVEADGSKTDVSNVVSPIDSAFADYQSHQIERFKVNGILGVLEYDDYRVYPHLPIEERNHKYPRDGMLNRGNYKVVNYEVIGLNHEGKPLNFEFTLDEKVWIDQENNDYDIVEHLLGYMYIYTVDELEKATVPEGTEVYKILKEEGSKIVGVYYKAQGDIGEEGSEVRAMAVHWNQAMDEFLKRMAVYDICEVPSPKK